MTTFSIREATAADMNTIRALFREYQRQLGVDLCFQGFEEELRNLPGSYAAPAGTLLLAVSGRDVCGCVGLRPLGPAECEMKRLYVRPAWRGRKIGRRLAAAVIDRARQAGYRGLVLDTLDSLHEAITLYRSIGFVPTAAYYANPLPGVSYWRYALADSPPR